MSDYYDVGGAPADNSFGDSSVIRNEFKAVQDGLTKKLPPISANSLKIVRVNAGATKLETVGTTGTGNVVMDTAPTISSLTLGTPLPIASGGTGSTTAVSKNDIINGDFRIAQAGTSFAAPVTGTYDLDGWRNGYVSAAVATIAKVSGSAAGRLARQVTITTADASVAAGDFFFDLTAVEGYNIEKYVGNTFTISFRAKVPVTGIHCVSLRNSGGDRSYVKEINFSAANTWQDCSFTVTGGLPAAGTWNYTNGIGLQVGFAHMCGTTFHTTPDAWQTGNFLGTVNQVNDCASVSNVWALEKVTMNLGTVAAVSDISYEQELLRCQRYYEKSYNAATAPGTSISSGLRSASAKDSSTNTRFFIRHAGLQPKRVTPTLQIFSEDGTANNISLYSNPATKIVVSTIAATSETSLGTYITGTTGDATEPYVFHFAASARL